MDIIGNGGCSTVQSQVSVGWIVVRKRMKPLSLSMLLPLLLLGLLGSPVAHAQCTIVNK